MTTQQLWTTSVTIDINQHIILHVSLTVKHFWSTVRPPDNV